MFGILKRKSSNDFQTQGVLKIYDFGGNLLFKCNTLELAWKDNQRNISCIPTGEYRVIRHSSAKYSKCFWVQDVPDRSEILIHAGNFYTDTRGCILPGKAWTDLNYDTFADVTDSRNTLNKLLDILPDEWTLTIQNDEKDIASAIGTPDSL